MIILVAEENCWSSGWRLPPLSELSHEHLAQDDVAGVLEDGGEDDGDSVCLGLDIHGLIISVVDNSLTLTLLASLLKIE